MCSKLPTNDVGIDTEFKGGVYWNRVIHWVNKNGYTYCLKFDEGKGFEIRTPVINGG